MYKEFGYWVVSVANNNNHSTEVALTPDAHESASGDWWEDVQHIPLIQNFIPISFTAIDQEDCGLLFWKIKHFQDL